MGTNGDGGIHLYKQTIYYMKAHHCKNEKIPFKMEEKVINGATRTCQKGIKILLHNAIARGWYRLVHTPSANLRMIESICEKSQIPNTKNKRAGIYGNTIFTPSPFPAYDLAIKEGKLNNGEQHFYYSRIRWWSYTFSGLMVDVEFNLKCIKRGSVVTRTSFSLISCPFGPYHNRNK